jgi:hypothetical protein
MRKDQDKLDFPAGIDLDSSETILGAYKNQDSILYNSVFFTDRGIIFPQVDIWRKIMYSDIQHIRFPSKGPETRGLTLLLSDQDEVFLPIEGRQGEKTNEVFEILRFLDRVVGDLRTT